MHLELIMLLSVSKSASLETIEVRLRQRRRVLDMQEVRERLERLVAEGVVRFDGKGYRLVE